MGSDLISQMGYCGLQRAQVKWLQQEALQMGPMPVLREMQASSRKGIDASLFLVGCLVQVGVALNQSEAPLASSSCLKT